VLMVVLLAGENVGAKRHHHHSLRKARNENVNDAIKQIETLIKTKGSEAVKNIGIAVKGHVKIVIQKQDDKAIAVDLVAAVVKDTLQISVRVVEDFDVKQAVTTLYELRFMPFAKKLTDALQPLVEVLKVLPDLYDPTFANCGTITVLYLKAVNLWDEPFLKAISMQVSEALKGQLTAPPLTVKGKGKLLTISPPKSLEPVLTNNKDDKVADLTFTQIEEMQTLVFKHITKDNYKAFRTL